MIPHRVQQIIDGIAAKHEVAAQDILGRSSHRAVELARLEAYRAVLRTPKPSGGTPSVAEVARWFSRSHATISVAVKEHA